MRTVIQRTLLPASVKVNEKISGEIEKGLIVYLGVEATDTSEDIAWLARKLINLRIFNDENGKMNLSLNDISGGILLISQFTLFASTKKGNRPSYLRSAPPEIAKEKYDEMILHIKENYNCPIATGIFGADMKVDYINDGPVTICIDTKNKE